MSSHRPPARTPLTLDATKPAPAGLDLAGAMHLVEAALASAGVAATDREHLACAKALVRLAPASCAHGNAEDFAAVLQDLGRG